MYAFIQKQYNMKFVMTRLYFSTKYQDCKHNILSYCDTGDTIKGLVHRHHNFSFYDVKNRAVCLQIDLSLYEWDFSVRLINLSHIWEPNPWQKNSDKQTTSFIKRVTMFRSKLC